MRLTKKNLKYIDKDDMANAISILEPMKKVDVEFFLDKTKGYVCVYPTIDPPIKDLFSLGRIYRKDDKFYYVTYDEWYNHWLCQNKEEFCRQLYAKIVGEF